MANNYKDGILGYDCDDKEIYEGAILVDMWALTLEDSENLEDPRMYCAVVADDGKAYAISIYDEERAKLIREKEHIPYGEDIPTIIKPINTMQYYEEIYDPNVKIDIEELRKIISTRLKEKPIEKDITDLNCDILALKNKGVSVKEISDGNHTFGEYIDMRNKMFIALCEANSNISWKSKKHFDEDNDPMYDGDFIAGINTPNGVITFHLKMKYWDELNVKEIDNSPKYDGYTEEDVKKRIKSLYKQN